LCTYNSFVEADFIVSFENFIFRCQSQIGLHGFSQPILNNFFVFFHGAGRRRKVVLLFLGRGAVLVATGVALRRGSISGPAWRLTKRCGEVE